VTHVWHPYTVSELPALDNELPRRCSHCPPNLEIGNHQKTKNLVAI